MTFPSLSPAPSLPWTGERMVPHQSDLATEAFHWQRYLFFRPWYAQASVVDAASGEGYGLAYAAAFARSALGYDLSEEAVRHARDRYPQATYAVGDVLAADYSQADLVLSFETIEHLPDPVAFLQRLRSCPGRIVVSTPNRLNHSPGNALTDAPHNPFHTVEWTPSEFAELVRSVFPDRTVRFLSQEARWPGTIREGLDETAKYVIAVIGDGALPSWPRLGLAVPTCEEFQRLRDAVVGLTRFYPGDLHFAVVANGSSPNALGELRRLRDEIPHLVSLIEAPENLGYGAGANLGLDHLWQEEYYDYFGVVNDDVLPAVDCVPQLVAAMRTLEEQGVRPGIVGPVSNEVSGPQRVDVGPYGSYSEMLRRAETRHLEWHSSATQWPQVRGLFMLIHPDCLSDIGGFDPIFGLGNFEDDDLNVRARLAGHTLWVADGAFLHHAGSSTFKKLELDYERNIVRNLALFLEKWEIETFEAAFVLEQGPEGVPLYSPLTRKAPRSAHRITINGEMVDLVHQASEFDLAAWIVTLLRDRPRSARTSVLDALRAA